MTVDAVCLDLDDTLVTYERSVAEVLALAFERAGVDPCFSASDYRGAYGDYADEADTVNELRRACFADLTADAGRDPETGRAVADAFAETRDQTRVECLPGARELLDGVDAPLALVTNGAPEMQRQKLRGAGIADAFDAVVFAGYDAPSKPDPEPFHRVLGELDAAPENAVHVGDSVSSDVAGARAAGLRAVWFRDGADRVPDPEPHRAFDDLHGVRAWLQSM